ncbi:hypothetical protein EAG_04703 [Camponotus floridanus]|uniref:Uncharacterized protein n=1 Tax=Camponotus floridanus TaxID=104421 RepID=E2ANL1_CAMFO|nr:hypothetical protein EAG_04703 [Camponotus floridanus]
MVLTADLTHAGSHDGVAEVASINSRFSAGRKPINRHRYVDPTKYETGFCQRLPCVLQNVTRSIRREDLETLRQLHEPWYRQGILATNAAWNNDNASEDNRLCKSGATSGTK